MSKSKILFISQESSDSTNLDDILKYMSVYNIEKNNSKVDIINKLLIIDNKYYKCNIEVESIKIDELLQNNNDINNFEGIVILCDLLNISNIDVSFLFNVTINYLRL